MYETSPQLYLLILWHTGHALIRNANRQVFSKDNNAELTEEQIGLLKIWNLLDKEEKQAVHQLVSLLVKHN